jgi:LPXTG-motif cell wall-anchored protein
LRYFLPSARRMRNIIGAGVAGTAATIAFATPALACEVQVQHTQACNADGRVEITWGLKIDERGKTGSILEEGGWAKPEDSDWREITPDSELSSDTWNSSVQILPIGATEATLHLETEIDGVGNKTVEKTVPVAVTCASTPASPTANPTASKSPTSSGALPVTGANTAIIAGVATVLVVGGAALFFVARRRRVTFTA